MRAIHSTNALIAITHLVVGVVFVLVGLPMIQEQVPPNSFFGIRIEETLSDEAMWYRVNKLGGYAMVLAGFCTSFTGVFAWRRKNQWSPKKMGLITVGGMVLYLVIFNTIAIQMAL